MEHFGREPLDRHLARMPRGQVYVIPDRCKGCGLCVEFCPIHVLQESATSNGRGYRIPETVPGKEKSCINCQFCSLICPDFAIYSEEVST